MSEGPIALKTRKEVIYILFNKIYKLSNLITESLLEDIFLEVHNEFKKDSYKFIKPIKDAIKFIKICKNFEINLVLISSDTESNTRQAVNILDIKQCFDLIIGGDSGFGDKTTGQSALHICKEFNLLPNQVITIGDAPADFYMAKNANLKGSILVDSGQISLDKLFQINNFCVSSLNDLILS